MDQDLKETIAAAIGLADSLPCPQNYADKHGYPDKDWISDWSAFLTERILYDLNEQGFTIFRPLVVSSSMPPAKEI